ncbi:MULTISPECIES: ABC transporter permease [Deinococcus]|jgi:ABC-type transport system involved in multi-copper enzyme maturation permease subunit|uniref:ABC-type transport system involved in multi-copper enzyme maturation permease subunit n=2 Tax=Deinococcus soli (ex Cha et al. 2016) TaxID=1309411 RepID=A0ACC6KMF0_9DEIO|nr:MULTISPECIES: ABC transporter permease [Deinococcus]MDK2012209.1 ABC transporter permease [Deinococcus sp. 43]MDR6220641.1 ABC-type transport system involved in multi-copper enzyme maturation permease subunit [Deinococcus soli (ex Cha et al. 2016)]MDR6330496.1 ABC-type transport system involved in multi-copper enzyme maturation permease subunit [Deinococcus soli (ex Cha et al. 2016)]MDR6753611.1 ABC-type transport system involved in multi-copper enzyme maturation permease subunit [Deinococcu
MRNVLLIAELSLREATRKRLVSVLLVLSALFLGFFLFGVYRLELTLDQRAIDAGLDGRSPTGAANLPVMFSALFGMYLVYFLGSLMGVLSTVGAVSGDIENGVMQSVIARPVSRAQLVAGRWLGFTAVNVAYVALLAAGLLGGVRLITGYTPPEALPAVALLLLAVTVLTSLTVLGSTLFTTLANGIGVFVLYGVGFTGGILSAIGTLADTPTLTTLGRVANAVMPTNALWLGASYHLQPEIMRQVGEVSRGANPFTSSVPVDPLLVLWAAILAGLGLAGAMWRFSRRDL